MAVAVDSAVDRAKQDARHLDQSPISVPVGRVGDRVSYETFQRNDPSQPWEPAPGSFGGGRFQVESLANAPDLFGGSHPAVVVRMDARQGDVPTNFLYPGESCCNFEFVKNYRISLDHKEIVSTTWDYRQNGSADPLAERQLSGANTLYGPWDLYISPEGNYGADYDGFEDVFGQFLPIVYQGHTFRLGQPVPSPVSRAVLGYAENDVFEGNFAILDFAYEVAVVDRRLVGDYDSYDLRSEGCFRARQFPDSWSHRSPETERAIPFLGVGIPWEALMCFQVDTWLTATVPYPVLVERAISVDGRPFHAYLQSLAAYKAGTTPIPWTEPRSSQRVRPAGDLEHSGRNVVYPAEGSGSSLPFGLTEALNTVQGSPLLTGYPAWAQRHPQHILAGYLLSPRQPDALVWDLVFGDRDGSAFVVTVEKGPSLPIPRATEVGEFQTEPFDAGLDWPTHTDSVTLAGAQKLWDRLLRDEWSKQPANYIRWGRSFSPAGFYCFEPGNCARQEANVSRGYTHWALLVGHASSEVPAGPVTLDPRLGSRGLDSYVVFDSVHEDVWHTGHVKEFVEFAPLGHVASPPMQPSSPMGPVPTMASLGIGTAVVVSSSLLALLLAIYFFPLLKFLGGQLAGVIPGYARLHRAELLNNRYRENLAALIRAEPGITPPELQAAVGGSWTTVVYHLKVLERSQLVSSLLDGRHKRFFPAETVSWGERGRIGALRNARTREVYRLIFGEPGSAPSDLAKQVGVSRPAIYWHIDRLERVGLVSHDRDRGRTRLYASDPGFSPGKTDEKAAVEVA